MGTKARRKKLRKGLDGRVGRKDTDQSSALALQKE
jgi:hypothetical protein